MKDYNLIPYPQIIKLGKPIHPDYLSGSDAVITTNGSNFLAAHICEKLGCSRNEIKTEQVQGLFYLSLGHKLESGSIILPESLKGQEEGYYLVAGETAATVAANSEKGLFYGVQTLRQLLTDGIRNELEITDWPQCPVRGFHLEARYGMPDFSRILEIMDEISHYKFNTLLLELEDKYPYASVPEITAGNALTPEQIGMLEQYARDRFIQTIPLQQTLGHLEYVLKKEEYFQLREVREEDPPVGIPFSKGVLGFNYYNNIDEICISNEEAVRLVQLLLDDVITLFPESRYVHIGCDEAWNLAYCSVCKGKADRNRLFLQHVNRMAEQVKSAGKVPVMWDDMLRHFNDAELQQLDKDIVLICWLYYSYETGSAKDLISRYRSFGYQVIGASSAKCSADLEAKYFDVPDLAERAVNMADWSGLCKELELPGVITTIWSNYTGTIAPPHPFFDTAWYPVLLSADLYWNGEAGFNRRFEERFFAHYFGVEIKESVFSNPYEEIYEIFHELCQKPLRHAYVAEAYQWMYLLSMYRRKSMVTNRELYRLQNGSTKYEKEIVIKRTEDLARMRQYVKTGITALMLRYYRESEVQEYVESRFFTDDLLERFVLSMKQQN